MEKEKAGGERGRSKEEKGREEGTEERDRLCDVWRGHDGGPPHLAVILRAKERTWKL